MCARYKISNASLNKLLAEFALDPMSETRIAFKPRYNIAPTQTVPVVRQLDGKRELVELHWGLIPSRAKDKKIAYSTINAKAETVATKPAFRSAYKKRRCLVIADGFYEWRTEGKAKLPMLFQVDGGEPFAFAGLWEWWGGGDKPVESCTILTTEPNELAAQVHNRMPVILDKEDYEAWLSGEQIPLVPFAADRMRARPVGTYVNNVRNQGPECIAPSE
jgi:putative SOS response-associated peptidase YedK